MYYVNYGPEHVTCSTLKLAREAAKRIAKRVMYEIKIVHNGDELERWTPRITSSGRVTFRHSVIE